MCTQVSRGTSAIGEKRPSEEAATCRDHLDICSVIIPRLDPVSQMRAVKVYKRWQHYTIAVLQKKTAEKIQKLVDFLVSNLDKDKYDVIRSILQTHFATQAILNTNSLIDIKQSLLLMHHTVAFVLRDVNDSDLQPLQRQLENIVCATATEVSLWELIAIYKREQTTSSFTDPLQKKRAYFSLIQDLISRNLLSEAFVIAQKVKYVFIQDPLFAMIAIKWAEQGKFYEACDVSCHIQDPTCRRAAFAYIGIALSAHPSFGEYACLLSKGLARKEDRTACLQFVILKLLEQKKWCLAMDLAMQTSQEFLEHVIKIVVPAFLEAKKIDFALHVATMSHNENHLMYFAVLFAHEELFDAIKSSFIDRIGNPKIFRSMIKRLAAIDLKQTFSLVIQHPNIPLKEAGLAALIPYLANQRPSEGSLDPSTDRVAKNYSRAVLAFNCVYTSDNKEAHKWAQEIDDLQLQELLLTLIAESLACQGNTKMVLDIKENISSEVLEYSVQFVLVLNLFYRRKVVEANKFVYGLAATDLQNIAIFLALENKFDIADQVISLLPDEENKNTQKIVLRIRNRNIDSQDPLMLNRAALGYYTKRSRKPHVPQITSISFESLEHLKERMLYDLAQDLIQQGLWDQARQITTMMLSLVQREAVLEQINITEESVRNL